MGSSSRTREGPGPLCWERGVLAAEPPGKSWSASRLMTPADFGTGCMQRVDCAADGLVVVPPCFPSQPTQPAPGPHPGPWVGEGSGCPPAWPAPLTGAPGPRGRHRCATVQFLMGSLASPPPLMVAGSSCLLPLLRRCKPCLHISRHSGLQLTASETCLFFPCVQTLWRLPPTDSTPAADDAGGPFLNCSFSHGFLISGPVSVPPCVSKC